MSTSEIPNGPCRKNYPFDPLNSAHTAMKFTFLKRNLMNVGLHVKISGTAENGLVLLSSSSAITLTGGYLPSPDFGRVKSIPVSVHRITITFM